MFKTLLSSKKYTTISPDVAIKLLNANKDILLLDVRTPEEYANLHIPNSKLLPLDQLQSGMSKIASDMDTNIIVYCHSGARAKIACNLLSEMGYTNVSNLGGIQSWPYETTR